MIEVTQADNERLKTYLTERNRRAFSGSTEPHANLLLETFAAHRTSSEDVGYQRGWHDAIDAAACAVIGYIHPEPNKLPGDLFASAVILAIEMKGLGK